MNVEGYAISVYRLDQYATCFHNRKYLEEELHEVLGLYYENYVRTSHDEALGLIQFGSSVEDAVFMVIKKKELYERMKSIYETKADLFAAALETLTDRERDVVKVHYFNHSNTLRLSNRYFNELLESAQKKMCLFIGQRIEDTDKNKEQIFREKMLQERKEKVKKWKQLNQKSKTSLTFINES